LIEVKSLKKSGLSCLYKLGDLVFSKQVLENQNFDLSSLPLGNYVIVIIGLENVFRKGIVKLD